MSASVHPPQSGESANASVLARERDRRTDPRPVPPNVFAIPFGLAGLATAWAYAAHRGLAPPAIRDALSLVAAIAWVGTLVAYLRPAARRSRTVSDDLTDPVAGPFVSVALIVPLVLVVDAVLLRAPGVARVIVDALIAAIVVQAPGTPASGSTDQRGSTNCIRDTSCQRSPAGSSAPRQRARAATSSWEKPCLAWG